MKNKFLFVAALATMGLTACSDDDVFDGDQVDEVSTYMTVRVTGEQLSPTRTLPNEGAQNGGVQVGSEGENKISNLLILLYDKSDVLKKAFVTTTMSNTADGAQTAVFPMVPGDYKVYVVANYSPRESEWVSMPGLDVKNIVIDDISMLMMQRNYAKANQFIMFNQCDGSDKKAGVPVEITAVNTIKNPATCTVELDRLAAKIQSRAGEVNIDALKTNLSEDVFKNMKVTFKGHKLMNGAKQTYLQQHWTNEKTMVYPYKNTLITPWMGHDEEEVDDEDPVVFNYYSKYSDFRTVVLDEDGKYTFVRDNYAMMPFYDDVTGPIYCMENNSTWNGTSVVDALRGNTTGLVYQFLLSYNGSDELAGTNCFYSYGGKFFPSLEAVQAAYPYVFDKASTSEDAAVDLTAAQDELRIAYGADDIYDGMAEFRAKYQIKVYMDGLMYYIYYIKDKNYIEGENHYYSVMRNTIYDFNVKELLRVGEDIPGGWNPDTKPTDPVDPTNTYMNVVVKVKPWVFSSEDISLE